MILPAFEVWVDDARFIASFTYGSPGFLVKAGPGAYRFSEMCFYRLGEEPATPYVWNSYDAVCFAVDALRKGEFPEAHVRRFDGKARRRIRWRGIPRGHGETS